MACWSQDPRRTPSCDLNNCNCVGLLAGNFEETASVQLLLSQCQASSLGVSLGLCSLSLSLYICLSLSPLLALSVCSSFPPTFCVLFHILRLMLCLIWGVTSFTSMLAFTLFVLLSFSSDCRLLKYASFFFSYLLPEKQQIKHIIPCIAFQSHQSSWEAFFALKSKHRHLKGNRWEQDLFVKIYWWF